MIPKVIHYVWLSDEKKPAIIEKCIASWKKCLPDYEFKLWTLKNVPAHHWVSEAVALRKWAFATDYIRAYAVYNEGGIYLDSDVFLKQSLDGFLGNRFFSAIEWNKDFFNGTDQAKYIGEDGHLADPAHCVAGLNVNAAIFGAEKGHPLLKSVLDFYDSNHFVFEEKLDSRFLAPVVFSKEAEKFGFVYKLQDQILENDARLYLHSVFASNLASARSDSAAIHLCTSMWRDYSFMEKLVWKLKIQVKSILLLR